MPALNPGETREKTIQSSFGLKVVRRNPMSFSSWVKANGFDFLHSFAILGTVAL